MKINHKIRNAKKYLTDIPISSKFVVCVVLSKGELNEKFDMIEAKEKSIYSPKLSNGVNARRNTIGEFVINKNKPKEYRYRAHEWHLKDWGGNWHSGVSMIPYECYSRDFIEPKNVKFTLSHLNDGKLILLANTVFKNDELSKKDLSSISFIVNLLVEAVGKAEILRLDSITGMPVRTITTVNWRILPRGERIWNYVKSGLNCVSKSEQWMIQKRLEVLESFMPMKIYKGLDSYTGYLVFYFETSGLYVFDSMMYGQATYVFEGNWRAISKLTKKQIITNKIAKERIVHNKDWKRKISRILSK